MMNKTLLVLMLFALSGCSTSAVSIRDAKSAPPERVLKFKAHSDGDAKLTVIRDSGMIAGGCYAAIFINREKVALINPSEKVTFSLPAGEYEVGAAIDGAGFCSVGKDRQERTVNLREKQEKAVRIYSDGEANLDVKPTTL